MPDPIDLEEHAKQGKAVPDRAAAYRIKIDKEVFVVEVPSMTGRELLQLAKKLPPEKYNLYEIIRGKPIKVALDETEQFSKQGLEKFKTLPLDQTEGD